MSLPYRPAAAYSLLPRLVLLFVLTAGLAGCGSSKDGNGERPAPIVQTTVEPLLADLPEALLAPELPPLGEPMPPPWAAAPVIKPGAAAAPAIAGIAAIVLDEASGTVLYDKEAHMVAAPASLTKIATLILALEDGRLDEWVASEVDSTAMRGSTVMGLLPGDSFTLRDLLYGLMLPSGNDAALAIGRFISGRDDLFVAEMNALMRRLGLVETTFANPHGLGGAAHYTSAYDLAVLSRYGMSLPGFREIVTARYWTARGSRTIPLANINSFLNRSSSSTRRAVESAQGLHEGPAALQLHPPDRELQVVALRKGRQHRMVEGGAA